MKIPAHSTATTLFAVRLCQLSLKLCSRSIRLDGRAIGNAPIHDMIRLISASLSSTKSHNPGYVKLKNYADYKDEEREMEEQRRRREEELQRSKYVGV